MIKWAVGGLIGVLAAVGMGTMIVYARKDPDKFRDMAASFLLNEIVVMSSIGFELW